MGQTRVNHASSLIIEDHLKKVISKTSTKGWKASDNPFLPRSQHSAFGDFPKDYMPKKTGAKREEEPAVDEASKTFKSKYSRILSSWALTANNIFAKHGFSNEARIGA